MRLVLGCEARNAPHFLMRFSALRMGMSQNYTGNWTAGVSPPFTRPTHVGVTLLLTHRQADLLGPTSDLRGADGFGVVGT